MILINISYYEHSGNVNLSPQVTVDGKGKLDKYGVMTASRNPNLDEIAIYNQLLQTMEKSGNKTLPSSLNMVEFTTLTNF